MKHYIKLILSLLAALTLSVSCDEEQILKEEPQDFLTLETAYKTFPQFERALTAIYAKTRSTVYPGRSSPDHRLNQWRGTDMFKEGRDNPNNRNRFGSYVLAYQPTASFPRFIWNDYYEIIAFANTILSRTEGSELSADERKQIEAETKFFRAFCYRYLVYHFGDIPLIINEVTEPKTDYARTPKNEVLAQMAQDFSDAAVGLPNIDEAQDGKLNKLVAQHYLAETNIALGKFDEAIAAASVVIDNPSTDLMRSRFGSLASDPRGNVYWDLFRADNQHRSTGNKEAIWVCNYEVDVPGGGLSTLRAEANTFERHHSPAVRGVPDPDGVPATLIQSTFEAAGRGVSFMAPTKWFAYDIWGDEIDTDMRSLNINFFRDFIFTNPASAYVGQLIRDNLTPGAISRPYFWYPYLTKVTTAGQHPDAVFQNKKTLELKSSAGSTYRDNYYVRLPETYLLRAEAFLGKGDQANAAADINVIRVRANANPVSPGDVDIDYILDERARELSLEAPRRLTLHRLGKIYQRVKAYNELNTDNVSEHHNLAPIPLNDIEANITGELTQNPGYN